MSDLSFQKGFRYSKGVIIPPFRKEGEDRAQFFCLAFVPVKYCKKKEPKIPATLAIYYCEHPGFTRFSLSSQTMDGEQLSYSRGDDDHDSLEFLLLRTALELGLEPAVHPAMWRLFLKDKIPPAFRSPGYWECRRELCKLLFVFRSQVYVQRLTADMPRHPLMVLEQSVGLLATGDLKVEDDEIDEALVWGIKPEH